jgi:hypothetical protein
MKDCQHKWHMFHGHLRAAFSFTYEHSILMVCEHCDAMTEFDVDDLYDWMNGEHKEMK